MQEPVCLIVSCVHTDFHIYSIFWYFTAHIFQYDISWTYQSFISIYTSFRGIPITWKRTNTCIGITCDTVFLRISSFPQRGSEPGAVVIKNVTSPRTSSVTVYNRALSARDTWGIARAAQRESVLSIHW